MSDAPASGPVVCGVDLSDRSAAVLREAARFAHAQGTSLEVTIAVDPLIAHAAATVQGEGTFLDGTRRDVEALVAGVRADFPGLPEIAVTVTVGEAAQVLCDRARATGARALVVGTRGYGAAGRMFFGSTAARLLAETVVPVLVVPDETPTQADGRVCERIVCGVDFGDASIAAAREAVALGSRVGAPVTLVHAVGGPRVRAAWQDTVHDVERAMAADARDRIAQLAAALPGPPGTAVSIGRAADVLLSHVAERPRALLVVGIGGGLTHRPGTTALALLTEATTPVLAVPVAGEGRRAG